MATSTMTALLDTCRAMTAKVTTQTFTLLPRSSSATQDVANAQSAQLLGVMAMGYEAPPLSLKTTTAPTTPSPAHDTRSQADIAASAVAAQASAETPTPTASPIAQQKAVFNPDINHKAHADWEAMHRHHTLLRQSMTRRGMLA
ncbi:hypothetical protein ACFO0O_08725 [Cobetia amphilecti]|jgi:hypothetical protein|uniref:Killing trait n=1 Tax=Cobetia amphilecti TaxID=1055104 RepID=A0ABT6UJM8_9GAMM|nr:MULTISPECIES: hypothetical protein [Cobetia]MBR9799203.1 hypothetical protein [Gammaproteobacteria bacterium]MBF10222.1 hypothetical protein [Cobetia sp.]MDH2298137.1 hypothetical protein [Cobetia sp. 29-18-1]MDI4661221.1 hypothetical protein [Cobetia sp. BMC6]MDI5882927.1 hypothetical protein [Cobetia amphilecti]|tara:strand:+ start:2162 stop:2593 length:432 start_codon:yes stop_codon:yes gene_type:complete